MKKLMILSMMFLAVLSASARKHVSESATVVADTIYYAANQQNVQDRGQAAYYRLLKQDGKGLNKEDVFQDLRVDTASSISAMTRTPFSMVRSLHTTSTARRSSMATMSMASVRATSHCSSATVVSLWWNITTESQNTTTSWLPCLTAHRRSVL